MNPRMIVAGHGDLATMETLDRLSKYNQALSETVEGLYESGMIRKDVVSKVKSLDGEYTQKVSGAVTASAFCEAVPLLRR